MPIEPECGNVELKNLAGRTLMLSLKVFKTRQCEPFYGCHMYVLTNLLPVQPRKVSQHLINDWSAILLCLPCIIFQEYMCGFLLFTEFWCFAFGFLLRDLAVVTKFGCHIEKIISF